MVLEPLRERNHAQRQSLGAICMTLEGFTKMILEKSWAIYWHRYRRYIIIYIALPNFCEIVETVI